MNLASSNTIFTRSFNLLWIANFLIAVAFYFLISSLPIYMTSVLKTGKTETGLVLASYTLASLIIRLFAGWAIDSHGRKIIYLVSLAVFALIFNAYILAVTVGIMLFIRILHGLAWGVTSTTGSTVVVDILPVLKRGEGLGYYGISMTIGMAIGPLIGIMIINNSSFNILFLIGGILSMAGFILALFVKYPDYETANKSRKFEWKSLIETSTLPIALNMFILMVGYGGLITFITIYGKEIGIKNPGLFFLVFALGVIISRTFSGRVFDKHGPKLITLTGILSLIIGFVTLSIFKNFPGFMASSIILGIGIGIIMPCFQAMVNNVIPQHNRGAANSTYFTSFDLGIGLGTIFMGFLSDLITLSHSFLVSSGICFIGMIVFLTYVLKYYDKKRIKII